MGVLNWPAEVVVGVRTAVDSTRGVMSPSVGFRSWPDEPLSTILSSALDTDVVVENDANLRALAEHTWGGGRGADDFLYVKTSPGVGAGLILQGKIYHGANGMAGELGHVVVDRNGPLCECGNRGCLHALASARMLLRQAKLVDEGITTIHDILERARQGDPPFVRLLSEAGTYAGLAIASIVSALGLTRVAVGGALADAGAPYMDPLREAVESHTLRRAGAPLDISSGMPDPDLALLGALCLGLERSKMWLTSLPPWARSLNDQ
jgi:predicted NBD/HSP70 family sugar kinase